MCQQWFQVIGLLLDIVGFLIIAREWFWAINLHGATVVEQVGDMRAEERARKFGKSWEADLPLDYWKYVWRGWTQQYKLRTRLFKIGSALIILGFLGQLLGSLPPGIPFFPFRPCWRRSERRK